MVGPMGNDLVGRLRETFAADALATMDGRRAQDCTAELTAQLTAQRAAALPDLRALLDGPPLPVRRLETDGSAVYYGGKLMAIQVLTSQYADEDVRRLWALASTADEPVPVRLAAACGWARLCSCEAVPDLVNLLVMTFEVTEDNAAELLAPFAASQSLMVRPLLGHLYQRERRYRARASHLLAALGEPAVPALREVIETTEDNFAREQAEAALAKIEREAERH